MKAKFQELWDGSRAFRTLFLQNKIFKSAANIDLGKAEVFWSERLPLVNWGLCGKDGCSTLTIDGVSCRKHDPSEKVPKWQWVKGVLFCYCGKHEYIGRGHNKWVKRYRAYHLLLAKRFFGCVPSGYVVHWRDGNPFNLRENNLILISRVLEPAVLGGVISVSTAIQLDDVLEDRVVELCGKGRPKSAWVYTVDGIAKAARIRSARVRQEISRGNVDPSSISSVVDFCHKMGAYSGGSLQGVQKIG